MLERRHLEVYFGPDYTGTVRLAPPDRQVRSPQHLDSLLPYNPWPDHVVALMAYRQELSDWARRELNDVAATRIVRYVRTCNPQELSTLTEKEVDQLRQKAQELGIQVRI